MEVHKPRKRGGVEIGNGALHNTLEDSKGHQDGCQKLQGRGHGRSCAYTSGQHFQAYGLIFGWASIEPGVGLNDPDGSLLAQDIQ